MTCWLFIAAFFFQRRLIINIKQNWQWTAAAAAKKLKKKWGTDTIPTVKWNPATAVFQCEHLLQNPRSGISRILLCRMKGGPVVISFTTRNGFVILFDLEARTEVYYGTFANHLSCWKFNAILYSVKAYLLKIEILVTKFPDYIHKSLKNLFIVVETKNKLENTYQTWLLLNNTVIFFTVSTYH